MSSTDIPLADLSLGTSARVVSVSGGGDSKATDEVGRRLSELGFLPGEAVRIVARGLLRAPIAVRIGTGTFALRLFEAACIRVCPEQPQLP
jgi:ferrous iron transport protein A